MPKSSRRRAKPIDVKNPPKRETESKKKRGLPPGRTLESEEHQLIGLASNLARKQMQQGTASSQVITHFLKLGSSLAKLEYEKLQRENELLTAKTDALVSQKKVEELYAQALQAMQLYSGSTPISRPSNDDELDE